MVKRKTPFPEVVARRMACMTEEEWEEWKRSNDSKILSYNHRAGSPCHDCTVEFAQEMRSRDMCDGEPGPPPPSPQALARLQQAEAGMQYALEARSRRVEAAVALHLSGVTESRDIGARLGVSADTARSYLRWARMEGRL